MASQRLLPVVGDPGQVSVIVSLGVRGPMTRADLARALRVSPATVTQVTKSLLAAGAIRELDAMPSRGGRPARLLGLVEPGGGALGAKVASDHITVVDVALDGTVRFASTHEFAAEAPDALDRLARVLKGFVENYEGLLLGVGIGVPGTVADQGVGAVQAPTIGWYDVRAGDLLRQVLDVPVLIDNDVNTVAVAEMLYGAARDYRSPIIVTIGRGVGAGVVVDGDLHRGIAGGAGEIGHTPVMDGGPVCGCGNTGCLEALVGEAGLVRRAHELGVLEDGEDSSYLRAAAEGGSAEARALFAEAGSLLGRALAGVVHAVAPEAVVLLGEGLSSWPLWEEAFETAFRGHLLPSRRSLPVIVEPWSDEKWAVGAASLVLHSPLDGTGASGDQGRLVRARLGAVTELG